MVSPNSRWSQMTPTLAFSCFALLTGYMLFGFDTGSFGGLLGNQGFINQFGYKTTSGKYKLTSLNTSLLTSLAYIGKFTGTMSCGPLTEWYGHRMVFVILVMFSFVGIVIEITSGRSGHGNGSVAQFIVGRIIVYISVGLVEVCVTTYQTEIVPAPLRGFAVTGLQLWLGGGIFLATGCNYAFQYDTTDRGWKTITGLQLIFPVLVLCCVPFLPDSPRWLLSKDRDEDALRSLRRLRATKDNDGDCDAELAMIKASLSSHVHKGSWISCFQGTNLRRTILVLVFWSYNQLTGSSFNSTYATVFYKTNGYADKAYTFVLVLCGMGQVLMLPCMFLVDVMGRRTALLISYPLQALFMFLLAGVGSIENKTQVQKNTVVAAFMLFSISNGLGGAQVPFVLGAELPAHAVREKTNALGASLNVVWSFVTNFTIPYMLAAINFKTGWIFGSLSCSAIFATFFFLPETKGLELEQIDDLFEHPFNPFKPYKVPPRPTEEVDVVVDEDLKREVSHDEIR